MSLFLHLNNNDIVIDQPLLAVLYLASKILRYTKKIEAQYNLSSR